MLGVDMGLGVSQNEEDTFASFRGKPIRLAD